jgi:hypothetical protein
MALGSNFSIPIVRNLAPVVAMREYVRSVNLCRSYRVLKSTLSAGESNPIDGLFIVLCR